MHIITEAGATVMLDGRPKFVPRSHPQWAAIKRQLQTDGPAGLERLIDPAATFAVDQVWRTRSGAEAIVTAIDGLTVTVEVDGCFEVETQAGEVSPGVPNDDDLTELLLK